MDEVKVVYQLSQKEYAAAWRKHWRVLMCTRWQTLAALILYTILIVGLIFHPTDGYDIVRGMMLASALFCPAIWGLHYLRTPNIQYKKLERKVGELAITFSANEIRRSTQDFSDELKWSLYCGIWESKDFFFLLMDKQFYHIIPKRAFADKQDMQAFRKMAAANLKVAKKI